MRDKMIDARRQVVKINSVLLTVDGHELDCNAIAVWIERMVALHRAGIKPVLVSSGAVTAGMSRLSWVSRPSAIHELQTAALVGQTGLVQAWESSLALHGLQTAQVLLTHDDLSDRECYLNAHNTLRTLVELGMTPVVSENDTVITDEIHLGDSDTLAALVADLVEADPLVTLTDRDGMFDADPRNNPDTQLTYKVHADDPQLDAVAGSSTGTLGRDGMQAKLRAARLATHPGGHTVIVGGRIGRVLDRPHAGERLGTLSTPDRNRRVARKQWLAGHLQVRGALVLDDSAVKTVSQDHRSLLPAGVKAVQGSLRRGEMVVCVDQSRREVTRGLIDCSVLEAQKVLGQPTDAIEALLGYVDESELVHHDSLVLV